MLPDQNRARPDALFDELNTFLHSFKYQIFILTFTIWNPTILCELGKIRWQYRWVDKCISSQKQEIQQNPLMFLLTFIWTIDVSFRLKDWPIQSITAKLLPNQSNIIEKGKIGNFVVSRCGYISRKRENEVKSTYRHLHLGVFNRFVCSNWEFDIALNRNSASRLKG